MDIPPFNRDFISSDKFKAHAFEQCAGYVAWWIKKGGGNIAIAARQSSADAFMGGAYALRDEIHARLTPLRLAKAFTFSKRQDGMPPLEVFQLDTVDGVSLRARATSTVPPKASIMSVAVCMTALLR